MLWLKKTLIQDAIEKSQKKFEKVRIFSQKRLVILVQTIYNREGKGRKGAFWRIFRERRRNKCHCFLQVKNSENSIR